MNLNDSCKMAVIGQSGVGKSSLVKRIVQNKFVDSIDSTIGAAFSCVTYKGIKYQIWDTAGQERYQALIPMYLRNAKVILVIYDVTSQDSVNKVKQQWIPFIEKNSENHHVVLIGNKCDMIKADFSDSPTIQDADTIAKEYSLPHIITSAKDNINISNVLDKVEEIVANNTESFFNKHTAKEENTITLNDELDNAHNTSTLVGCIGCNLM